MSEASIKDIMRQEYIKCLQDPVHFMRKYCMVQHPTRGRVNFNLYPFQEQVLKLWLKNDYSIINKSRQLGISTLAAGFSLWTMLFHKDKTVLCIATKQSTAVNMVDKVQFMYQQLPGWLKGKEKPDSNNKLSLKLSNGSQIVASSAASDAGRSYAVSLLLIDEAAFIDGIDRIYTAIKPTISSGGGCIALSSPNGIGNWFHKTWVGAINNENSFLPIKLPWEVHPERDAQWFENEKANMGPQEIAQEYECDFLASGNNVVTNDILEYYEQNHISDPVERRGMSGDYWIWEYPNPTETYVVCADVARGDGSDYSTFHIIATTGSVSKLIGVIMPTTTVGSSTGKGFEKTTWAVPSGSITGSFGITLSGSGVTAQNITASANPTSVDSFANVLGTSVKGSKKGYMYSYFSEYVTSIASLTGSTISFVSQSANALVNLSGSAGAYSKANTPWIQSQIISGERSNLFRLHTLGVKIPVFGS